MEPEEREQLLMKVDKLERTIRTLTKYISVRGGVVQINAPLSIKGDIEFKEVRILTGTGSPHLSLVAPLGSMYCRLDGSTGSSFYTNFDGDDGWNDS